MEIDVRQSVAVSEHEGLVAEPGCETFDSAAGVGFRAGVDQVYEPIFACRIVRLDGATRQVDRQAAAELRACD